MAAQTQTQKSTIIVKITYGKEMRRFSHLADSLSWSGLSKRVVELFGLPPASRLALTYIDDDGDNITLSTDDELTDAVGLALSNTPSVLRLTLVRPVKSESPKKERPTPSAQALPDGVAPELAPFLRSMASQLGNLPEGLRSMLANYEVDAAATATANCAPGQGSPKPGVHVGVTCDRSGMSPIVGDRYHLVGHDYDLCQAEYDKVSAEEKALYRKIPPPTAGANINGIHPGVECDRSGMCPIVGVRYHLKGHDYDLCQAEYDKLADKDKAQYEAIQPPTLAPPAAAASFGWRPGMWGWRANGGRCGGQAGFGPGGGRWGCRADGAAGGPKLAARFVRDISIFDGTQMPPGTPFTKIWRLKNIGEVPWPSGTKITFVGGDQMSTEMMAPLARQSAVQPGEEVDVAVEMCAPQEHGRYLGYWRLTGPHGRRKFGQRVWCHVQVVDPANPQSALTAFDDLSRTLAEIETKKAELAAANEPDVDMDPSQEDTPAPAGPSGAPAAAPEVVTTQVEDPVGPTNVLGAGSGNEKVEAEAVAEAAALDVSDGATTDDMVLVTDGMLVEEGAKPSTEETATEEMLRSMGFEGDEMIRVVVRQHGNDLDACTRILAEAREWGGHLNDLDEMGFNDRERNAELLLKNRGNVKRTVRDLIEA